MGTIITNTFLFSLGNVIQLQEQLLREANRSRRISSEFLESFATLVGADWPSLAFALSLTRDEVEEMKTKWEELALKEHAQRMLEKWSTREDATYGQLCTTLTAIPLLQYCKEQ